MSALGTEFKYGLRIEPIGDLHFDLFDFEVETYVFENKSIIYKKNDGIHIQKIDQDSFKVIVDEADAIRIGRGKVLAKVKVYIPDGDFIGGIRTEVYDKIWTKIIIT